MPDDKVTRWLAPAKLNLCLQIIARRADGYHSLQTAFQLVDYGDELIFNIRDDGSIRRRGSLPEVPEDQDLCLHAARALQDFAKCELGADIELTKRLPLGGGLGGGSSDAATTLLALNQLWGLRLDRDALLHLARQLGADVPVFVFGHSAWGEGIGEQLTAISLPHRWYVVVTPPVEVSTARVFSELKLTPENHPITIRDFLAGGGRNDLESTVVELYPPVGDALRWLRGFGDARLTGSGASVFLPVQDRIQGQSVLAQRPKDYAGFVARGLDRHPVLAEADDDDATELGQ